MLAVIFAWHRVINLKTAWWDFKFIFISNTVMLYTVMCLMYMQDALYRHAHESWTISYHFPNIFFNYSSYFHVTDYITSAVMVSTKTGAAVYIFWELPKL